MDSSVISALSALSGAATGGLLSIFASWLVNRRQVRAQWLSHDKAHREELYKEFIEEAAKARQARHCLPGHPLRKTEPHAGPVVEQGRSEWRAIDHEDHRELFPAR